MTNGEKFKDEIWRIACDGSNIAIKDGELCKCNDITCNECSFLHGSDECEEYIKEWCKSEYIEYETDWSKVPVDTKVLVKSSLESKEIKRYFSRYEYGMVVIYDYGCTSWSGTSESAYIYAELANEEDKIKYRKRVE